MKTEHTPEPWHAPGLAEIHDSGHRVIALLSDVDPVQEELRPSPSTAEGDANARRIVACVNACAGMPTWKLERDGLPSVDEYIAIEKQRDDLLAVFSVVISEMEDRDRNDGNAPGHGHKIPGIWDSDNGSLSGKPCAWCAVWAKAKELIASVKGGAA